MKSAYGRTVPSEDAELTHVEPGSPMGELLRRHWQPVALSDELGDLPKLVRILCEDLVVFRTGSGEVGCLEPHCSHRGTSLEFGRIEESGIRCCYHGWVYAPDGRVVEMPCEPAGMCERMAIEHPAYPVLEYGGVVFAYLGPPGTQPLFPLYDVIDLAGRRDVVLRGRRLWQDYAIGYVRDCNWLQHYENVVDPWHLVILHQMISGDQFDSAMMVGSSRIDFERTALGIRYKVQKDLPNGNRLVRYAEAIVPNLVLIPDIHEKGASPKRQDRCSELTWVVPTDNLHVSAISICVWPLENGVPQPDYRPRTDTIIPVRPGSSPVRAYDERQRRPDDLEAQESQRAIAVHALENLASGDGGIVRLRRLLREQVRAVQAGREPLNVVREAAANRAIPTHAWNTILSPEEAARHRGEEA
jgi:nitrite reductase/ring-hydroxylating ferredoxin subunit